MSKVYLALYKGRKQIKSPKDLIYRFIDWGIRKATRGEYSHCEIAIQMPDGQFDCYSSSFRDGGVRCKRMELPSDKWDLIELPKPNLSYGKTMKLWRDTKGEKYDLKGVLCTKSIFRRLKIQQSKNKWFCSEWCAHALGFSNPHLFTPAMIANRYGLGYAK